MLAIIKSQRLYFILYILFLLFGLGLMVVYSKEDIFLFVNQHHSDFSDRLFYYATSLGNGWGFLVLATISIFYKYKNFFTVVYALILQTVIVQLMKKVIFSESIRPYKYFQEIGLKDIHLIEGVKVHSYLSFPSGHTITAFCVFTLLLLFINKKQLGPLFLLLALIVGYSRIYLAQHFFIDVYIGSIISVCSTIFVYWLVNIKAIHPFSRKKWIEEKLRLIK